MAPLFEPLRVQPFGKTVRQRRLEQGLSIEELAGRSGLTPNYLGSIELGKRDPSLSSILAIAKGLHLAPIGLFGGIDGLGPDGTEAGRLIETLTDEDRLTVMRLLRSLSRRRK